MKSIVSSQPVAEGGQLLPFTHIMQSSQFAGSSSSSDSDEWNQGKKKNKIHKTAKNKNFYNSFMDMQKQMSVDGSSLDPSGKIIEETPGRTTTPLLNHVQKRNMLSSQGSGISSKIHDVGANPISYKSSKKNYLDVNVKPISYPRADSSDDTMNF